VFLWHHPIALKLTEANDRGLFTSFRMLGITAATFAIAVACAALSYYVVERPILRYKDRLPRRRVERVERVGASGGDARPSLVPGGSEGNGEGGPG
jgi:peptidoglycan/LPS O-acetylase OafA/YrhL